MPLQSSEPQFKDGSVYREKRPTGVPSWLAKWARASFIGAAAAHAAGFRRILVLCPPHLTRKWKREVEETVPQARAAIVTSITDLERLRLSVGPAPLFAVMSRERAKLSYRWSPAVIQRWAAAGGRLVRDEQTGEPFQVPCCPCCHAQVVDKDGVPLTNEELSRKRRDCDLCGSALWRVKAERGWYYLC